MIRTDTEFHNAVSRAREDKMLMEQQRKGFTGQGFSVEEVDILMQPSESFHAQLMDEIQWYESICNGNELPVMRIGNIGRMLIALRISRKISQKQLAQRLGVSEAQVSRDENNDYHGITVARVERILKALNASMEAKVVNLPDSTVESEISDLPDGTIESENSNGPFLELVGE